jgi:hypothetical protein
MKNAIRSRANLKKVFISLANHPHPRPGLLLSRVILLTVVVMRGVWGETHNSSRMWITHEPLNTTTDTKQVLC